MSVLDNEVNAKVVETKSMEANVTIQKILEMICQHWEKCLDSYYIMDSEPELSIDNYSDSVTINLDSSDRVNIEHIISDVTLLFEEELENFIKDKNAAELTHQKNHEEGENGSL